MTKRIAMWSGPRNISTAMMRSWGSRGDTHVTDEPLYACYLATTGREHPGRDEIVACYETDWRRVVETLVGPVPGGRAIWFQKHMTLHLTDDVGRDWLEELDHAFLIRDPREVLLSYSRVVSDPTPEDLGFPQQRALWEDVARRTGRVPPILDSRDVRDRPEAALRALCAALDVPWDPAMLSWEPGRRETDGIWAPHWYGNVERSTSFAPWTPSPGEVPVELGGVLEACRHDWDVLRERALRLAPD